MSTSALPAATRLLLLAPSAHVVPESFARLRIDGERHARLLADIQRVRGRAYLEDGAITSDALTADGRHIQHIDETSWHVVAVDPDDRVLACARYREVVGDTNDADLGVWRTPLAADPSWQTRLRHAVRGDASRARRRGVSFVEVGGWAVERSKRGGVCAFQTAAATFALAESLGGCIGITTATVRHCSARILRKLGGASLAVAGLAIPAYFDPHYGCHMEILRFDSAAPSPRYVRQIQRMSALLADAPVVAAHWVGDALAGCTADIASAATARAGDLELAADAA